MKSREVWLRERLKTILLATDFYQNSRLALAYASALARQFGGKLTVLNAFEFGPHSETVEILDHIPSRERRDAQKALKEFTAGAGLDDILAEEVVVEGFVPSAIIKVLYDLDVDVLVIGTEGIHRGLDHLLLGSNTEALILGSNRPTLTVGPLVPELVRSLPSCEKVIYVSDLSVASIAAATFAAALGEAFNAEIEVHQLVSKATIQDAPRLRNLAAQYCDLARFADPDLPPSWYDIDFQLSRIVVEDEFLAALSKSGNLIVMGVQPASFLQRHLHTSLAYRLLSNAASPVLTIPAGVLLKKSQ